MSEDSLQVSTPTIEQDAPCASEVGEYGQTKVEDIGRFAVGNEPVAEEATEVVEKSEREIFIDDLLSNLQSVGIATEEFVTDLAKRLQATKPELLGATGELVEKMFIDPAALGISLDVAGRSIRPIFLAFGLEEEHVDGIVMSTKSYENADKLEVKRIRGFNTRYNIEILAAIARRNPDAPRILADKYGIRNFYRYKPSLLIGQLEAAQNLFDIREAQLVITAHADENGAFSHLPKQVEEDSLYTKTIFAEAGSMTDIARILLAVANYKSITRSTRLERIIIGAHGSKVGITLGTAERGKRAHITRKDIARSHALSSLVDKGILSPRADVILAACLTGEKNGFAQIVSERIDLDIIAPDQVAAVVVEDNTGQTKRSLRYDPSGYFDRRTMTTKLGGALSRLKTHSDSATAVYRNGRKNNVRQYTLSHRRPGETARRLTR